MKKLKAWFAPHYSQAGKNQPYLPLLQRGSDTHGTRLIQCKCRLIVPQCNKIRNSRRMYSLTGVPQQLMMFIWWRKLSTCATCLYIISLRLRVKLMHLGTLSAFQKFHPCLSGQYLTSHKQKLTTLITAYCSSVSNAKGQNNEK